jgi:anti-sigma factor RsiW
MGVMSCSRIENQILPYVGGRLKASEQRDVETHLAACPACRLRVSEFRAVSVLLDELPQIEPSPAFDLRVHARVAAEPVKKSWWPMFAPSPRAAFAASMLLLATVWIGSQPQIPANTPVAVNDEQLKQINEDLPVLENFDVLANFEPLTDLPQPVQGDDSDQQDSNQPM